MKKDSQVLGGTSGFGVSIKMNYKQKLIILYCITFIGCVSLPPTANLQEPKKQNPVAQVVVIERATVIGLSDSYKKATEDSLTINIKEFLEKGNYFDKVALFTEKDPGLKNYQNFQFHFSKYKHERKLYPLYFPLAFLTATLYIWFGGTITTDELHYACDLNVNDEKNKTLFQIKKEIMEEKDINWYSDEKFFPGGAAARTKLIIEILEEYKKQRNIK